MLEFVDSDLYFVQDKNNCINTLLQVGSGSVEKVPDPAGQKSPDPTGSGSSSQLSCFSSLFLSSISPLSLVIFRALFSLPDFCHSFFNQPLIKLNARYKNRP